MGFLNPNYTFTIISIAENNLVKHEQNMTASATCVRTAFIFFSLGCIPEQVKTDLNLG